MSGAFLRRIAQVGNHLVDRIFQKGGNPPCASTVMERRQVALWQRRFAILGNPRAVIFVVRARRRAGSRFP